MRPTECVLDMFAVPGDIEAMPGGRGQRVRAGDLVLSPGRTATTDDLLNPSLARLAVELDTRPGRDHRDLRIAVPVPARDGRWVIEGWGASRHEPGARALTDLAALRAVGAILHAEMARAITSWAPPRDESQHRAQPPMEASAAARVAFGEDEPPPGSPTLAALIQQRLDLPLGPDQLVHGDLARHALLTSAGAPLVSDVVPHWRPALWAEALCTLDAVLWLGADPEVMVGWVEAEAGQAMVRAAIYRLLTDDLLDADICADALTPLLAARPS